jgi:L-malate glycosyltransferase
MNILFYTPFNSRSRDTESVMEKFVQEGYNVYLLTQAERGIYHKVCDSLGVKTKSSYVRFTNYFLKNFIYLIKLIVFCKRNKINLIYAHLESAGLIAVFAQFFIKAKVVVCRHIVDEAYLFKNRNFILGNKLIYFLAKNVIVVSKRSKDFMVEVEKVNPDKITVINLAYNFSLYDTPDYDRVKKIRSEYNSKLLILTACRLVDPKRPEVTIKIIEKLIKNGQDVKCIILGKGPLEKKLKEYVVKNNLSNHVFLLGHVSNLIDFLSASDVLLHPSLLDSSSVIIKEAGLVGKTVITCKNVGDVNEYLINGENSFLVDKENVIAEACSVINKIYNEINSLDKMGVALHDKIFNLFSISKIYPEYEKFHLRIFHK